MTLALVMVAFMPGFAATAFVLFAFFFAYYIYEPPYRGLYPDLLPDSVFGRAQGAQHVMRGIAIGAALVGGGVLLAVWEPFPFVLAATGLLNGRRATTHWRYTDMLSREYPDIHVDPAVLYVDEGDILTSAGSAAGIDLGLHIIRRDFGARVVNAVARRLVMAPHREGGQAQFIQHPVGDPAEPWLSDLLQWLMLFNNVVLNIRSIKTGDMPFRRA